MATNTDADGGTDKTAVHQVVRSGTFFDRAMDLDYRYAVYWDEERERFDYKEFGHVEQHEFDFRSADEEIQKRYREMVTRRRELREYRKALGEWVSQSRECPVCLTEQIFTRSKPDAVSDCDSVKFCPDCETNTFYSQSFNGHFAHGVTGPGWHGKKYGAAIGGFLSPSSNAAKRAVETGDSEREQIHKFARQLRELREECGYDPNLRVGPEESDE